MCKRDVTPADETMWLTYAWLMMAAQAAAVQAAAGCPDEFTQLGQICYRFIDHQYTWWQAKYACTSMGAHLAEPRTLQENTYIKRLAASYNSPRTFIGGTDLTTEGQWYWATSGDRISEFEDWLPGGPSGGPRQNCMQLYQVENYQWDDVECHIKRWAICQIVLEVPTTERPSTHAESTPNSGECQDGNFGLNCTKTCQCSNKSEICDKLNGSCVSGCLAGWKGVGCQVRECQDGNFGLNCTKTCQCSNKTEICDKLNGSCVSGCLVGWKGINCQWRDCSHLAYCGIHICKELRHDYSCSCLDGYKNTDFQHCEDIDECEQEDVCDIHTCRNTEGSYDCICRSEHYENMRHELCVPKIETMEQDDVLPEILVLVVIQTLSVIVSTVLVLLALLCVRTVAMAIWRFYTTEPYTRNIHFPEITNRLMQHLVIYEMEQESDDDSIDETLCEVESVTLSMTDVIEESVTGFSGQEKIGCSISHIASSSAFLRTLSSVTFSISKLKKSVPQTDVIEEKSLSGINHEGMIGQSIRKYSSSVD